MGEGGEGGRKGEEAEEELGASGGVGEGGENCWKRVAKARTPFGPFGAVRYFFCAQFILFVGGGGCVISCCHLRS